MAKKQSKKGNGNLAKAKLPAGFTSTSASGEFGEFHDFSKKPILTGKVVDTGSIEGEFGKQRTITIQNGRVLATVCESKGLRGLFDTKGLKGKTAFIQFLGTKKIGKPRRDGSQKTFKQFASGVK